VESNSDRLQNIESNQTTVVGVNKFTNTEKSPLVSGDGGIMVVDPLVEKDQIDRLNLWRSKRDEGLVNEALLNLREAASEGRNIMPSSIQAAKAGATTGEWAQEMRKIYGEYRGPTGVATGISNKTEGLEEIRSAVDAVSDRLGERLKFLIGKPGLDGHSNGAEQIASRARDCGMNIEYQGIRLTPQELVETVKKTKSHVIGLSILSGSHIPLVQDMINLLAQEGLTNIPIVVGGIIPEEDEMKLLKMGISKVYTPKDFEMNTIMMDIVNLAEPKEIAAE
jgi:(2R)-ethylmalonyl-CoA mutase